MNKYILPVGAGVGVLAATAIALRVHAVSKAKAAQSTAKAPAAATNLPVQAAKTNAVASLAATAATQGITPELQRVIDTQGEQTPAQVAEVLAAIQAKSAGDNVATTGQTAVVTTHDEPPSGDLIIRDAPSASATQIGGAEKDGTVIVLDSSDATFARIQWGGGSRLPAATGFARKAFLKLV
jgi:hypothetical protein